jgi:MFS family permease
MTHDGASRQSWLPMTIIAMGQAQMSLNTNSMPVSIGGIVAEFHTAPTTVGTAIVANSLAVAGFAMLGAKFGQKFGALNVFRLGSALLLASMLMMTFSPDVVTMIVAQVIAGLAAAAIVPTLVALIVHNYWGAQQAKALGILGAVQAIAAVAAFFIAGVVGTYLGWRFAFGLVIPVTALTLLLSMRLKAVPRVPNVKIDWVGATLAAVAVALISLGVNNLHDWGVVLASAPAPLSVLGLSPALVMVVAGIIGIQLFIAWAQHRQTRHLTPLLALKVIESPREHAAAIAMMAIFMLANALTFLVPLYIEIVQGKSSLDTAVAMIPYQLAVFAAAILVLSLYDRLTPRQIARYSFVLVSAALVVLGVEMRNEFSDPFVVMALIMFGLGQGALATLLFNVLVTYAPREFAGDVGSLRGTIKSLAAGVGTALAGALAVGFLNANVQRSLVDNPAIPPKLITQVDLGAANFVSNLRLKDAMSSAEASSEQIAEAVRINTESRRHALKLSFLLLGGVALLVIVPVGRLPDYVSGKTRNASLQR